MTWCVLPNSQSTPYATQALGASSRIGIDLWKQYGMIQLRQRTFHHRNAKEVRVCLHP